MKNYVQDLIDSVILDFQEDGMEVNIPDEVLNKLRDEIMQRMCDALNECRDDIEMDIRAFAKEKTENV